MLWRAYDFTDTMALRRGVQNGLQEGDYHFQMGLCLATLSCSFGGSCSQFHYWARDERLRLWFCWAVRRSLYSVAHVGIINRQSRPQSTKVKEVGQHQQQQNQVKRTVCFNLLPNCLCFPASPSHTSSLHSPVDAVSTSNCPGKIPLPHPHPCHSTTWTH